MAAVPEVTPAPEAASKKPYISPSQLNTFENCGEAYRRRYIEKEIIPPGVAALRGGGVHKGAEMNFKQKIESRVDLPKKDIVDRAVAEFDGRMKADGLFLDAEAAARGKDIVVGEERDTTARLAGLFRDTVAPIYQPTTVETTIKIELPNSPRDLLGILDLTGIIKAPEAVMEVIDPAAPEGIVDYKTGKKTKSQAEFDSSAQITIYDLSYRAKHGKPPAFLRVEQLIDTKVPKRVLTETTRTIADIKPAVARVNAMISGLEKGVFMPANAGAWNCSPRWCGYYTTCAFVNAERRAAAAAGE